MQRVLLVVAHPDDETLGAGGTIARHAESGDEVTVVVLGGVTSSREGGPSPHRDECADAMAKLGARELKRHALSDNRFDQLPLLQIVKIVEEEIARVRPEIVYTHAASDLNVDHRLTHEAVKTATRPLPGSPVKRVLAFETLSSTEWNFGTAAPFTPNVFVAIGSCLGKKLAAMRCYESELRTFPHPRSLEAIRLQARLRGTQTGVEAAEAFQLVRELT